MSSTGKLVKLNYRTINIRQIDLYTNVQESVMIYLGLVEGRIEGTSGPVP